VVSIAAQPKLLSENEYDAALAGALAAASSRDRRVTKEEEFYSGNQLTGSRKLVSAFAGPDSRMVEIIENFNGKASKLRSMKIGDEFFCREGDKGWTRVRRDCAGKDRSMVIPAGDYEYSVEDDPNISGRRVYTRRATYTDSGSAHRIAVRLKFIEIKFVTDEAGAITEYREVRRGGVEPNGWSSTQVTRYTYEPEGLRIVDPTREGE
jgi:hypothetical protein